MKFLILDLLVLLNLASCTSIDKQTCQNSDWRRIGYRDGRNGRQVKEFRSDEAKCENLGTPLNSDQYFKGYASGITAYCTHANGLYVGSQGEDYHKQCPRSIESEFLIGYVEGKRGYDRIEMEKKRTNSLINAGRQVSNQCTFNSDCNVERSCTFSKCDGSNSKCTFDSDCNIEGACDFGRCNF